MITPYIAPDVLEHGGGIIQAATLTNTPIEKWLDLSTGINPYGWPVPAIPPSTWQRLPETNDGLEHAVQQYFSLKDHDVKTTHATNSYSTNYDATNFIVTAGSQASIQLLPQLFAKGIVWVPEEGYAEHAYWWSFYQHNVFFYRTADLENIINNDSSSEDLPFDTLVVINPNNPTAHCHSRSFLEKVLSRIEAGNKQLVVDEAFLDTQPEQSMLRHSHNQNLVVLRSLGKFFGLAGIRCGFLFSHPTLLHEAKKHLGPWQIATPSRWVATQALNDKKWHIQTAQRLQKTSHQLLDLLQSYLPSGNVISYSRNDLFCSVLFSNATTQTSIYRHLLEHTILVRTFSPHFRLRFGLPKNEHEWEKLTQTIQGITL